MPRPAPRPRRSLCPPRRPRSCGSAVQGSARSSDHPAHQAPHALGPVEFMGRQRQQVDGDIFPKIDGNLANRLGRIGVDRNAPLVRERRHAFHRLQHAGFVVRPDDRHERGFRLDRRLELPLVEQALGVDPDPRHPPALALENFERRLDGRVLAADVTRCRVASRARYAPFRAAPCCWPPWRRR